MPVVLNQLLSDRRPAAQALLRELMLNADGTVRSDATTQQILQVWLAAADQAAAVAAGESVGSSGGSSSSGESGNVAARGSSLVASLAVGGVADAASAADAAAAAAGEGGLDLAALLLDGRNAPLRRIAMDANPAATISSMPPDMRHQLKEVRGGVLGRQACLLLACTAEPTGACSAFALSTVDLPLLSTCRFWWRPWAAVARPRGSQTPRLLPAHSASASSCFSGVWLM